MDAYTSASYEASTIITKKYSTSFGLSIKLFDASLRPHIYAIYGLVRIADEIVDTYQGDDKVSVLAALAAETKSALKSGYSTNPVVHAFAVTAQKYKITWSLVKPFFDSMAMDLLDQKYDQKLYEKYIYGSAEVVGLMCLKVFTTPLEYKNLERGARFLGSAYQKVNFLRDIAADSKDLGRWYFPYGSFETFDEQLKSSIVHEIEGEFAQAKTAINQLPPSCRRAVLLSYKYYLQLLQKIKQTPAEALLKTRIRVPDPIKIALFLQSYGAKRA